MPTAASAVFAIPELLELILLSLPNDTTHDEIRSMRTIYLARTTCRTWDALLKHSALIRERLYLPTAVSKTNSTVYRDESAFPPAQPNPWVPHLLLNQRSWGSAWPFDGEYATLGGLQPSEPRYWAFSFEISAAQRKRLPPPGPWREMLASNPPFTDAFATRAFYELGSGRAPFVMHLDYNPTLAKSQQKYRLSSPEGITLGMIVDVVRELFGKHPNAKFVMIESIRCPSSESDGGSLSDLSRDRPATKAYLPGSSAEREYGWQRE